MEKEKNMNIEADERGTYYLIKLSGHFGGKNILKLRKSIEEALEIGHSRIGLDLSEVEFIDTMGIGTMVNINKRIIDLEGVFGIINPSEVVRRLLEQAGTHRSVPVFYEKPDQIDKIFE